MAVKSTQAARSSLATALTGNMQEQRPAQSYWRTALRTLRQDRLTLGALVFVLLIGLAAAGAGVITTALGVEVNATNPSNAMRAWDSEKEST